MQGVAIVHVYSQHKLSRSSENETNIIVKAYKEVDILFGADLKSNNSVEFRYSEPKKLKEIEKFFVEFFILSANTGLDKMFQDYCKKHFKYVDIDLINHINELIITEKNRNKFCTTETIYYKITETIEHRKKSWEAYKLQANQPEAAKELTNVSDILVIASDLKPLVIGRESEKDILNNPSMYSSINFSRIEDNDFYTDNEFKQENSFKDNNISFIQRKEDQSVSNLPIQSIINLNKNLTYKSSQADEFNNESIELTNQQQYNELIHNEVKYIAKDNEEQTDSAFIKQRNATVLRTHPSQRDCMLNDNLLQK